MDIINLSGIQPGMAFLVLVIPGWILWKYRTEINKKLFRASLQIVLQLLFVGYYLEYLFKYDHPWIKAVWIFLMVIVADFATIDRSELKRRLSVPIPIFAATFLGIVIVDLFFLEVVIQLPKLLGAQYTFPLPAWCLATACTVM